jgi:hypothetical protein
MSDNLKQIISDNGYTLDYKNYYLNKTMKILINLIITYIFLKFILNNENEFTNFEQILSICAFSCVLLYILDSNFPSCSITL